MTASRATRILVCAGAALATAGLARPRPCAASGFLIYDISGQAMGRASAVTADDPEPAAVFYNPAQLTDMPGVNASVGGAFVTSKATFSPAGGGADVDTTRGNFFLPALFANALVTDRIAVGIGAYSVFGIGIHWPDDWIGREFLIKARLETFTLNPTVAFKVNPQISVAAGFDAVRSTVDYTTGLPALVGGDVRLGAGTWGFGFNLAGLYKIYPDRLHVGLTYRSRVSLDFTGQANFSPTNPDFAAALPDQTGTASITLPDIISLGVMGRPRPDLTLTFDTNIVLWSTYDEVNIRFQSAPGLNIVPNGHDTFTLRGGADWLLPWVPGLHARGGLIYDHGAIPSSNLGPGLPDSDRIDVALGVGYGIGHFKGDLGYLLVIFLPNDSTGGLEGPVGTYNTIANLIGITISATWP